MHRTRRGVLVIVLLLLCVHLFLLPSTALEEETAEQTNDDFDFRLNFVSESHQSSAVRNSTPLDTSTFRFYLPTGVQCSPTSVPDQAPPEAAVNIPIEISFASQLLEYPSFTSRQFHLQVVYASDEQPQPKWVSLEFNFEHAEVVGGADSGDATRAALNATASFQLPCGHYAARASVADLVSGVSFAFSEEIEIVVAASSHGFDFCYLVQAPARFDTSHLTQAEASFAMVLQWKSASRQAHSMFMPNSTWNQVALQTRIESQFISRT
jgi:hypothetical protein